MHPYISQILAAERARDLQKEASAARLARRARRGRRLAVTLGASTGQHLPHPGSPPDSYAEFLVRTSGPLVGEPSAAERAVGQTVR
jgi:hypothetical protein